MIRKLKFLWQLYQNMGWDYIQFRSRYEVSRKVGFLKKKFPTQPIQKSFISLKSWKKSPINFFFEDRNSLEFKKNPSEKLKEEYDNFLTGKLRYFNAAYYEIGRDYDWLTNPINDFQYDIFKHWTEVEDITSEAGDIKFVWEKSRFSYLYMLIRYDYHFNEDCSLLVFQEIENWINTNPINQGPNYKCSQEISLRTLNWIFALYYYKNSVYLTENLFQKILHVIYWQLHHVSQNINFSRKTVRNNHAITEVMMLYLGGLLFPFFPNADKWKTNGKEWFEQEILYQIYEDGTFLQFSHNYHRVVVQLLTWIFCLSELNGERFSQRVYERASKTLNYLYQSMNLDNGHLPNYGSNDGALFFKFNNADYRDYRPQLNALHYFLNRTYLFPENYLTEDTEWLGKGYFSGEKKLKSITQKNITTFANGGYYIINDDDETKTFIKCGSYKDRPSHADNLHIDIWYKGRNILRDAGTYKYNTKPEFSQYFNGTKAHNTCTLGDFDQMKKGPRFIWFNWSKREKASLTEISDYYLFEGVIQAFQHIDTKALHTRKVTKHQKKPYWKIEDVFHHSTNLPIKQYWNIADGFEEDFIIEAFDENGVNIPSTITTGWYSSFYGVKELTKVIFFETKMKKIKTIIQLK